MAGLRYTAVIIAGVLCGLAGAYLSVGQAAGLPAQHDRGPRLHRARRPDLRQVAAWPALGACFLFGLLDASANQLQGLSLPGIGEVPVQAIQALPYLMTVILLAGVIGKAIPPRAAGVPYVKER